MRVDRLHVEGVSEMIGKGVLVCVATIFLAAITGTVGAQADDVEVPGFYYYSSVEGMVPLILSTQIVGLRFEDGLSLEQQAEILSTERDVRPFEDRLQRGVLEREQMVVVPLKPGLSPSSVLAIIRSLSAKRGVEFATLAFQVMEGYHELLTDRFYASFPVSIPEEDIAALNAEHAVAVVEIKDYSRIGKMGYRLRVTRDSGMNALDMANLYYETGLTDGCTPSPLPLYSMIPEYLPPLFEIVMPSGDAEKEFDSLTIRWIDRDPNDVNPTDDDIDAAISLYYDTDSDGRDGTLIVSGISEDDESDEYVWDLSDVPSGTYWIYGEMYDRIYPPVYSYSPGSVHVKPEDVFADVDGSGRVDAVDVQNVINAVLGIQ